MSEKAISMREKMAKLRASFVEQLPGRITEAQSLLERMVVGCGDHDTVAGLHRILHNFKGTGRSFGFAELGTAAAQGEELTARMLDMPDGQPPEFWRGPLEECLDNIERVIAAIVAAGGNGREEVPDFILPDGNSDSESGHSGRVVYLCDDDTLLVEQMAVQLGCFGYEAHAFTDADALREAILVRRPDALILDINFPSGSQDGTEILSSLRRKIAPQVPAIFLSVRNDFEARLNAVQAGGQAYFNKPARVLDLVAALDNLSQQHSQESYRILIVDDEPEVAGYHGLILQEAGMAVRQISEPVRILDVLREFRPDMVLMDMYMPTCTGHQLAKVIRQVPEYIGLPIVFLSSETDKAKQFSAMRVGAEGFLTKPVAPEELVAAVAIRAERMRVLRSLMAKDSLTGLFNHTTTTRLLENAISSARRRGANLCFVMIDIDRFKSVNDRYGHPVGDQVILALSRLMQQRLRTTDIIGRYGGEEFAVILHDVSEDKAMKIIDQLREIFNRVVFRAGDVEFSCCFSAGIAGFPRHERLERLREAADQALYAAKRGGRNRVIVDKETA